MLDRQWYLVKEDSIYVRFLETNPQGAWVETSSPAYGKQHTIKFVTWKYIEVWTLYPIDQDKVP